MLAGMKPEYLCALWLLEVDVGSVALIVLAQGGRPSAGPHQVAHSEVQSHCYPCLA